MIKVMWAHILATVIALYAIGAAGDECSVGHVSQCYNDLVHYEGLGFPLYGEDALELDDTCRAMNDSFDCVNDYVASCHGASVCDEECKEMIADIGVFSLNTGLRDLQGELCNPESAVRMTYLENFVCLEDNANQYAACHNDSQMSQEFMSTIKDDKESVNARCCFFSWYHDCFTNITRLSCGVNATFFVSFSLHKLVGHIAQYVCKDNPIVCDRPPMPPEGGSLDDEKPDQTDNEIDNSLDDAAKASSSAIAASAFIVIGSFFLSKYMFLIK